MKNTHGCNEKLAEQPEGQCELWRENDKSFKVEEFYTINTWIGGDHVPSIISNNAWVDSKVHLRFSFFQLLKQ